MLNRCQYQVLTWSYVPWALTWRCVNFLRLKSGLGDCSQDAAAGWSHMPRCREKRAGRRSRGEAVVGLGLIILTRGELLADSRLRGSLHSRAEISNSLAQLDGWLAIASPELCFSARSLWPPELQSSGLQSSNCVLHHFPQTCWEPRIPMFQRKGNTECIS